MCRSDRGWIVGDTSHWLMIAAIENNRKFHRTTGGGAECHSTSRRLSFRIDRCRFQFTRMNAFATLPLRMAY